MTSLTEIRARTDELDERIVALVAERQRCVEAAAAHEKDDAGVAAPARVEQVIARVRAHAERLGALPDLWRRPTA